MKLVFRKGAQIPWLLGVTLCLSACQLTQAKSGDTSSPEPVVAPKTQSETQQSKTESKPSGGQSGTQEPQTAGSTSGPGEPRYSSLEKRFLSKAETAFRKGNFFYPTHDNAYDRFNSVLLLNPDNQQAKTGLQAILLRYTNVTRDSIKNGRLTSARNYLQDLEEFYPDHPLVKKLRRQLNQKQKTMYRPQEQIMQAEKHLDYEEIKLSKFELGDKSDAIKEALESIALRLRSTDESILIFARSDREGRWIYKQMKQAVTDYRIRGDIRISPTPRIRVLPPL